MNIVCPQCGFGRDVPEDRLPGKAVIATCPKCGNRFRISSDGVSDAADASPRTGAPSAPADDPLPPGAIIPGRDTPSESDSMQQEGVRTGTPPPPPPDSGEDYEAYRKNAAEAYERQAADAAPESAASSFAVKNPWDTPQQDGYLAAFYQTSMRVMFAAPRFFAGLRPDVPQTMPLIFYLVVCVFETLVERGWVEVVSSALDPGASSDPQLQKLLQMLALQVSLPMHVLLRTTIAAMELFLVAGLCHIAFRLVAPERANYALTFQVFAYSTAPALLCVVPVAGALAGLVWGVACSFIGCHYALRLSWGQVLAALAPIYLLQAMIMLFMGGLFM